MTSKPNSISTQAQGVFLNCGPGVNNYELQFNCKGPACTSISSFQNVKCNPDGGSMSCSNDFKCPPGIASFQSNFTFQQNEPDPWNPLMMAEPDNARVQQQQRIGLPNCAKYSLTSDGTKEGTKIEDGGKEEKNCPKVQETPSPTAGVGLAKKTSSSSATRPQTGVTGRPDPAQASTGSRRSISQPIVFLTVLLGLMSLIPGTYASSEHARRGELRERAQLRVRAVSDKVRAFASNFGADLAAKANAQGQNGEVFAHNLVADVISSVCDEYFGGTRPNDFQPVIIQSCVKTVYGAEKLPLPAGQFLAVFGASLLCDYVISEAYPVAQEFFPDGCEGLQDLARKVSPSRPAVSNAITPAATPASQPAASLNPPSPSPVSNIIPTVSQPVASNVVSPIPSAGPSIAQSVAPPQSPTPNTPASPSPQQQSVSANALASSQVIVPQSSAGAQSPTQVVSNPPQSVQQSSVPAGNSIQTRTPAGSELPLPSSQPSPVVTPVSSGATPGSTEVVLTSVVVPSSVPQQSSVIPVNSITPVTPSRATPATDTPIVSSISIASRESEIPSRPITQTTPASSIREPSPSSSPVISSPVEESSRVSSAEPVTSASSQPSRSSDIPSSIVSRSSSPVVPPTSSERVSSSISLSSSTSSISVISSSSQRSTTPVPSTSSSVPSSIRSSIPSSTPSSTVFPSNSSIIISRTTITPPRSNSSTTLPPTTITPTPSNSTTSSSTTPSPSCPSSFDRPVVCPGYGCVDIMNNNTHCGGCRDSCSNGLQCYKGVCLCPETRLQPSNGTCGEIEPPTCPVGYSLIESYQYCCPIRQPSKREKRQSDPFNEYYLTYCTCLGGGRINPEYGCAASRPGVSSSSSSVRITSSSRVVVSLSSTVQPPSSSIPPPSSSIISLSSSDRPSSQPPSSRPTPSTSIPPPQTTTPPTTPTPSTPPVCPRTLPHTCAGSCVNTFNDASRCGGCSNACSSGWSCSSGVCYTAQVIGVLAVGTDSSTPVPAVSTTASIPRLASDALESLRPLTVVTSTPTPTPTPRVEVASTTAPPQGSATPVVKAGGLIMSGLIGWW